MDFVTICCVSIWNCVDLINLDFPGHALLVTYMCHNLVIIIMLENNEQNMSHNDNATKSKYLYIWSRCVLVSQVYSVV